MYRVRDRPLNFLCAIGWHRWWYATYYYRQCKKCGKRRQWREEKDYVCGDLYTILSTTVLKKHKTTKE